MKTFTLKLTGQFQNYGHLFVARRAQMSPADLQQLHSKGRRLIQGWGCGKETPLAAPADVGSDDMIYIQTSGQQDIECGLFVGNSQKAAIILRAGETVLRVRVLTPTDYQQRKTNELFCGADQISPDYFVIFEKNSADRATNIARDAKSATARSSNRGR